MTFEPGKLNVGGDPSAGSGTFYTYRSATDELADILTDGYFNSRKEIFRSGDMVLVDAADGGAIVRVAAVNPVTVIRQGLNAAPTYAGIDAPGFYIDPTNGSDRNNGLSPTSPKATANSLDSVLGAGQTLWIKRGELLRDGLSITNRIATSSDPIFVRPYGDAIRPPIVLGATNEAGPWASVAGTEYNTDFTYDPRNVFHVPSADYSYGNVVKLIEGTASSLASNEYAYVSGTGKLHINIGSDPTGETIEVPRNGTLYGLLVQGSQYVDISGIDFLMANENGLEFSSSSANCRAQNCKAWFSGNDGIGVHAGSSGIDIIKCSSRRNGQERVASPSAGGAGDGIAFHDGTGGTVKYCDVLDNERGGVSHTGGASVVTHGNLCKNNNVNLRVYAGTGA